ncbi:MAG: hypothetical protein CBC35_09220 [Planctomycetes bacterium TMED75]|nr:MAG: hypothetical protein CBC35_09220 [Planctomycetes bacterium TMED75]
MRRKDEKRITMNHQTPPRRRPHEGFRMPGACLLAILPILATTASAAAQADPAPHSFAEAFFISHAVDVNGVRSVEWLGSIVIWLLMATSVASIGLIGQLAAANRRASIAPEVVMHRAAEYVDAGRYKETMAMLSEPDAESDFSTILLGGLERAPAGFQSMEGGLEQNATEVIARRTRHVEILNVIGQVSPMVGLFGTVYGMILAFQSIVASGGNADPVLLAGGIGTALVTTFWGLVVAIPALAGYAALRGRLDASLTEAISEAETILEKFRPGDAASDARLRSASESPKP